eukprot:9307642-Alexandrium_andersonii.AAC.1
MPGSMREPRTRRPDGSFSSSPVHLLAKGAERLSGVWDCSSVPFLECLEYGEDVALEPIDVESAIWASASFPD